MLTAARAQTAFMVAVETNDAKAVHDLLYCPDYPIWATGFQLAHPMVRARLRCPWQHTQV